MHWKTRRQTLPPQSMKVDETKKCIGSGGPNKWRCQYPDANELFAQKSHVFVRNRSPPKSPVWPLSVWQSIFRIRTNTRFPSFVTRFVTQESKIEITLESIFQQNFAPFCSPYCERSLVWALGHFVGSASISFPFRCQRFKRGKKERANIIRLIYEGISRAGKKKRNRNEPCSCPGHHPIHSVDQLRIWLRATTSSSRSRESFLGFAS